MRCSACKKDVGFRARHWVCSVSTCNRNRTRLVFCSVACWDSHVAVLRHRDAWAVEAIAPTAQEWHAETAATAPPAPARAAVTATPESAPRRMVAAPAPATATAADEERDILIVVSRMKKYIRDRSGMNCADSVAEALSDHVRRLCDESIRTAAGDGRKTVLDRDVPRVG
jgi:histone H3/H4